MVGTARLVHAPGVVGETGGPRGTATGAGFWADDRANDSAMSLGRFCYLSGSGSSDIAK